MAKKFEAETVALTDPAAVRGDAQANISALGRTTAATNIATGRQGTQAGFLDLMQGGLAFVDPAAAKAIQQFTAQNQVSPKDLSEQGRLQAIVSSGKNSKGKPLTAKQIAQAQKKLDALTTKIDTRQQRVQDFTQQTIASSPSAADVMRQADPSTYANIDRAQGIADSMGSITDAGRRFMGALGQGYQAANIGSRDVTAAQMGRVANVGAQQVQASRMGDFGRAASRDIGAGQVGAGLLGQSLLQRAMSGVAQGGRLSAEAERDAVQAARQGFAARGLATGNTAMAAELLNRDRSRRQREMEDLQFASGVQSQELGRQFQNVGNQLAADQANQSAALQAELANLQASYNAAVQNGNWQQAAAIANQEATLRADMANQQTAFATNQFNTSELNRVGMFNSEQGLRGQIANEEARRLGNQMNIGMLGDATNYEQRLQDRGLGASLQMAGVQQQANPLMRALAFDPYGTRGSGTQALGPGTQLASNVMQNNSQLGMFNANALNWQNAYNSYGNYGNQQSGASMLMGGLGGAASGAATGFMVGGPYGAAIGGAAGLGLGLLGSK